MNGGRPDESAVLAAIRQAVAAASAGRIDEALRDLGSDGAVLRHPAGQNVLGTLLMRRGRTADALRAFDAAIGLAPDFTDAQCNRGVALQKMGRNGEALAAYDAALRSDARHATALFNRGNVLKLLNRLDEAAAAFDRLLALQPQSADARLQRAYVRHDLGQHGPALADFEAVLQAGPGSVEAAIGRTSALVSLRRFDEALRSIDAVLAAGPANGNALLIRGQILVELGRAEEALAVADGIATANLAGGKAALLRAGALWRLGRRAEAIAAGEDAARRDPSDRQAHQMLSNFYLVMGDFARGWAEYEYRGERVSAQQAAVEELAPRWKGEDIAGKTVLAFAEQGIGDTIQFIRLLSALHRRGAKVKALVQPPLLKLARSLPAPVAWFDSAKGATGCDYQIPLLSLPHVLGTRLDTIPAAVPYLSADPARAAAWRERIGVHGRRIGVVWQGNPAYRNDARRSALLRFFAPISAVPGVRLISLQAVHGLDQLNDLPAGMTVETLGAQISANPDGIAEIAAVMAHLDLVVSSDTAMAHLAGALGRPVWVALSDDPDWRWLLGRDDSPWYPTMRLFRQGRPGDWAGVFARMAEALRGLPAG